MSEMIEVMARADVEYFWREGGTHFENFEKPVSQGVRNRMWAILAALSTAGFDVRKPAPLSPQQRPAEAVRNVAELALNDAIEITLLIALMRGQNSGGVNRQLEKAGAGKAGRVLKNALLARLLTMIVRSYSEPRDGDRHLRVAVQLLEDKATREIFETGDGAERLAAFDKQWIACRGDHRLPRLKEFRDKFTAHLGEARDIEEASYKDAFAFGAATAKTMELLALAAGVAIKPLETDPSLVASPEAFWAPWRKD